MLSGTLLLLTTICVFATMAGVGQRPYALFVISDVSTEVGVADLSHLSHLLTRKYQVLNQLLDQANEEDPDDALLFLPTASDLSDAPRKRADGEVSDGTPTPISNYTSPFTGQTIQQVAFVLRDAAEEIDLERRLFAIVNSNSGETKTITVCRRGNRDYEGDEVEWYRIPATEAALELDAMEPGTWEEHKTAYDRQYPD